MTMQPVEIERKVRQLDNDVQAIYELLLGIQGTLGRHGNRFDELAEDNDSITQRLTALETKLTGLDTTVTGLDTKVDVMSSQLDTVVQLLRGVGPASTSVRS